MVLFYQDLDLVPTDIAAGLILVQRDQENISTSSGRTYNTFTELSTRSVSAELTKIVMFQSFKSCKQG